MCPRRRPSLAARVIDGEVVILDHAAGKVHHLNVTASCIWDSCNGSRSVAEIAARVAASFEVTPEAAFEGVTAALMEFQQLGLLLAEHAEPG